MPRTQKRKGTRVEHEMVKRLQDEGIHAWRVPGSGAFGGRLNSDLKIGHQEEFDVEVKSRKGGAGFQTLENWLGSNDLLFLKRNYTDPMVVMEWKTFVGFMRCWQECNPESGQGADLQSGPMGQDSELILGSADAVRTEEASSSSPQASGGGRGAGGTGSKVDDV